LLVKAPKVLMAGLVALILASPALAQGKLIQGADVDAILNLAQGWGTAELETNDIGDPMISGRMSGLLYSIFFYGCIKHQDCRSIQFYASWIDSVMENDKINEWNATRRWPTAMRTDTDSVAIKMDVNLSGGGISLGNFDDWFAWWNVGLETFNDYVIGE